MLSLKLALLLGLSLVATLVHAQDLHDEKGNAVHILTREELKKIAKERSDARDEAVAAEKRGDYAAAEAAYRRICTLMGRDESFEHIWLARLFDKTKDDRRAYAEYRTVVVGADGANSSDQRDSVILTRFGDLCLRYSTVEDAQRAYGLAVANGRQGHTEETVLPIVRNESLQVLRSAAHTAAAIEHWGHLEPKEELAELDLAVQFDDKNWVARIYRAEAYRKTGRNAEATREGMLAEKMAQGADLEAVRHMRWWARIADEQGKLPPPPVIKNPAPPTANAAKP